MSNAMYYAQRFGQPSVLLRDRLGTVPPRAAPSVSLLGGELLEFGEAGD